MSLSLLLYLRAVNAFDHQPGFEMLRECHVPFEEFVDSRAIESRLEEAAVRGGRIALVGPSGCGKTSVISHVLGDRSKHLASLVIPVSSVRPELMSEPTTVADRMISLISRAARDQDLIAPREEEAALLRAAAHKTVTAGRDIKGSVGLNAGWFKGDLATDLSRQVEAAVDITPEEKLEAVSQVLTSIVAADLIPVLVFDDTDRWLSGKGIESPEKVVESFFGRVVRWVADLGCGLVVAVHESYFQQVPRDELLETFDTEVDIPPLPDADSTQKIIERRLAVSTATSEFSEVSADDLFEEGAIEALFEMYSESGHRLRWLVRTVHMALTESCDAGDDRISVAAISAAGVADL